MIDNVIPCYAEAYTSSRVYGGPEEGGWYYTTYTLTEAVKTRCTCPPPNVLWVTFHDPDYPMDPDFYHDDPDAELTPEPPTVELRHESAHESACPAVVALRALEYPTPEEAQWQPEEDPRRQEFTEAYITGGGAWNPDGPDDPPEDYRGEEVTRAGAPDYFTLALTTGELQHREPPRYA